MCLAVPGKVIEILQTKEQETSASGPLGIVDFQGSRVEASLAMTPNAGVGDWVLVHAGFAIAQLDDEEAQATFESIAEAMIDNE
jgi:hydrogenase expression/formation protein HypC